MIATYTAKHIAKAIRELRNVGVDGVIIGSTSIDLELGKTVFEGDIDLFVTSVSLIAEEDNIRSLAEERQWSVGSTELGTPAIVMNIDDADIVVELYENVLDFYIPYEALELCKHVKSIDDENIAYIAPECWIVFKARRGSNQDMDALVELKNLIDRNEIRIDVNLINRLLELYEEDSKYIRSRLKSIGIV